MVSNLPPLISLIHVALHPDGAELVEEYDVKTGDLLGETRSCRMSPGMERLAKVRLTLEDIFTVPHPFRTFALWVTWVFMGDTVYIGFHG